MQVSPLPPDEDDVEKLTVMGKGLLETLKRVFPFEVKVGRYSKRSMWCNEKVHSILHAPRTSFAWAGPRTFRVR